MGLESEKAGGRKKEGGGEGGEGRGRERSASVVGENQRVNGNTTD